MLFRYTVVLLLCFSFVAKCNLQEHVSESDEGQNQTTESKINETAGGSKNQEGASVEHKAEPYRCANYREISSSVLPDTPSVLNVTSKELSDILQDNAIVNRCVIVYFYASWSHYSCEYALQYNAIGRAFDSLPILAVDLLYNDVYVTYVQYMLCFIL